MKRRSLSNKVKTFGCIDFLVVGLSLTLSETGSAQVSSPQTNSQTTIIYQPVGAPPPPPPQQFLSPPPPHLQLFSPPLPPPPSQQLLPGQKAGTYAFNYSGSVIFSQEPAFPVKVSITDMMRKPLSEITVKDGSPFTISGDLPPGSFRIVSNVSPDKDAIYWVAFGPEFFIDQKGLLTYQPGNITLKHIKKITVISPDWKGTETITDARPLLKWQPLEGAVRYKVFWLTHQPQGKIDWNEGGSSGEITGTEYRLPTDAIPKRRYEWSVQALGQENQTLGYWSAAYFFTPGGKEALKHDSLPISVKKGTPYLGISPMPTQLLGQSGLLPPGFPRGILVMGVLPNSPALKAGLLPHDVLTSFNGHSLEDSSVEKFMGLVQQVPVETQVPVEFVRNGVKKSTNVIIEAKP